MRILFISYRKLSFAILLTFLAIVTVVILYFSLVLSGTNETGTIFTASSIVKAYKTLETDTNGNGKKDTITVKIDEINKEYSIEVLNDNNKKFMLLPAPGSKVFGFYSELDPMKIAIADINMDRISEIIMQIPKSAYNAALYIFRWDGREYENILSGPYEGISIADVTGDDIPEVIAEENIPGIGETYTAYLWVVKAYNKINFKLDTTARGYDKIRDMMKMIGTPFQEKFPSSLNLSQYFTDDWIRDTKNSEYLKNFSKDIVGIELKDYINEDQGKEIEKAPSLSTWNLRYLIFRKYDTRIKAESYNAQIVVEKAEGSHKNYKIKSIKFIGQ